MPTALPVLAAACALSFAVRVPSQDPGGLAPEKVHALVVEAIERWANEYESGRMGAKASVRQSAGLQPAYLSLARQAGFLSDTEMQRLTHFDVLQKLLFHAEKNPSDAMADAVLGVAAIGLDRSFLDRNALELREAGHWTLMHMEHQGALFVVLRAAAGERVPVFDSLRPDLEVNEAVTVGPARRVAALRFLGERALPVFRSTLEAALVDRDPRVRLAAAESIRPPWRIETIKRLANALTEERHPVVSQAMVRLLLKMLQRPPRGLLKTTREEVIKAAIGQLGRIGWRTDMDLLDLVETFPTKDAIPKLIQAMDLELKSPDALVTAVNKRASPLLRERAGTLLRAMTGALVPVDDLAGWRAFWEQEQNNLVVPERLAMQRPQGTRVQFFGVPVTGTSIAFLIDTSGSMKEAPAYDQPITGPRSRRKAKSRLDAAKEQLTLAAQAMAEESQYFIMTFSDGAHRWTRTPIRPHRRNTRSLTELLSRLHAKGGTNLYDGLVMALEMDGRGFGQDTLPKIDELFVLSDGKPTQGAVQDIESILSIVKDANKYAKVRINTVFTGSGGGKELLQRLAEENDGVFVQR